MKLSVKNSAKGRQKSRKHSPSFSPSFFLYLPANTSFKWNKEKKLEEKEGFPCQMYSLVYLICLNVHPPPMDKSKNRPMYGKGSARAELAERWKMGNLWQMAIFWIRRTGNQASTGPLPLAWEGIFSISSLRPMKNITSFPKCLETAGHFSRMESFYHKFFIFDPSSCQCLMDQRKWNKNNFVSFYLPSMNCQVWRIPTFFNYFLFPLRISAGQLDKAIYPAWLATSCAVAQS